MQVIVSCLGKFHAFHLAEKLDKENYLLKLLTSFYSKKRKFLPEFRIDTENVDVNKVFTNIFPELFFKIFNRCPFIGNNSIWNFYANDFFDLWAGNYVKDCDIFVGFAGASLHSIRKARRQGIKTILERGSTHILFQKEILEKEYERLGIKADFLNKKMIQKELQEYKEADYISIPSDFVKQSFIQKGFDGKKLIQVPYGVDPLCFKKEKKSDNIFRIIITGGLTVRKGLHYLLQAVSELNLKNAELLIAGTVNNELEYFLRKYNSCYRYAGKIQQDKLYKYYSQSSVFVMPSIEEGLAIAQLEAMACQLPVICTTNTGGMDIIRDGIDGFVIPVRDIEVLKDKLLYLYNNPQVAGDMGYSAEKRIRENFTWKHYGEKMILKYKEIARELK